MEAQKVDALQASIAKKLWPLWIAVGLPLVLVVLDAMPIGSDLFYVILGIPALLLVWVCLGILALILAVLGMRRREWSRAAVCAAFPLVIIGAGTRFGDFIHFCNYGGAVLHFIVERPAYLREIRATPLNGEPRLIVFNRGGMSWASRGYVYDESDEVMRDEALQSPGWKLRANQTELTCGYYAEPLLGHFSFTQHWYVASFNC